ncbi:MAG TPA: VCBS repeat-containing protein, partial [Candidatus Kryptonia bacterium]|nr:VCBS repeat-containing protein [Candidatus Kryptonia bacterium]
METPTIAVSGSGTSRWRWLALVALWFVAAPGAARAQVAQLQFTKQPKIPINLAGTVGRPSLGLAKITNSQFLDLVVASADGVDFFRGSATGLTQGNTVDVSGGATAVVTGLFNDDTNLDIAALVDLNVVVALGNGDGTFQPPQAYGTGDLGLPIALAAGDFDGDNIVDLAVLLDSENVYLLRGQSDGTFQPFSTSTLDTTQTGGVNIVAADVNGDKRIDLLVVNTFSDTVTKFNGQGDGTFGSPVQI